VAALGAQLAVLAAVAGLDAVGWIAGIGCGVAAAVGIGYGRLRYAHDLGPADLVTLTRVILACGIAGLVASAFHRDPAAGALLALTVAALALDAVDGLVARRTRTASAFGASFDGETDAFLILVLSVYVTRTMGAWVLAIGAARYVFAMAAWVLPWLREPAPARYWCKVVAAIQGIVLAFAAADIAPRPLTQTAVAVALALLAESFGREALWKWRHRRSELDTERIAAGPLQPVRKRQTGAA
jgi:phosphatidylglycerophosphate synthase